MCDLRPALPLSFDLVVATTGERIRELERLLKSIAAQSHAGVRVILVDQSVGQAVSELVEAFQSDLQIVRIWSERGLSRARNRALPGTVADVVAFPDDDCWYPPTLLRDVAARLGGAPELAGVTGRAVDASGIPTGARWCAAPSMIGRHNVWNTAISFTLFLRRDTIDRVGRFDERLGLGSGTPWGSGEETDYLLRALDLGLKIAYEPSLAVFHPAKVRWEGGFGVGRSYGAGMGAVLRRHGYPIRSILGHIARPAIGAVLSLARARLGEARFRLSVAAGRAAGYLTAES